jgi:hypothetical protein
LSGPQPEQNNLNLWPEPSLVPRVDRLDDDDTRAREGMKKSSSPESIDADALATELVERWGIIDPELVIGEFGIELITLMHFRFLALDEKGALRNVRSMSGYFLTAVRKQAAVPGPLPKLRQLPEREDPVEEPDDYLSRYLQAQKDRGNQ